MSKSQNLISISLIVMVCITTTITLNSCVTPDKLPGVCKDLGECPFLLGKFHANYSDPYLRQCACGHTEGSPLMCCPSNTAGTATLITTTTTTPRTTRTRTTRTRTTPRTTRTTTTPRTTRTTTTTTTPRTTMPIPEPTDINSIKNHRNLGLINNRKCGIDNSVRIFTGKKTALYQYKWNAMLHFKRTFGTRELKFMCGGSLIADKYVLSAAHCVTEAKADRYELVSVRLGEWDQSTDLDCVNATSCAPPVQDIKVKSYKVHEMYNDELSVNDILLIKLENPVKYDMNIKIICLPTNENELITKAINLDKLIITGWGKTENADYSDIMLFANIPFVPLDKCMEKMKNKGIKNQLDSSHICAGGVDSKDTCQGDSGGPLVGIIMKPKYGNDKATFYQFGIVSVGVGCRNEGILPGVYTNVAYYMNWILDQMDE